MELTRIVVFVFISPMLFNARTSGEKITLTVIYDSYCPHSIKFIRDNLVNATKLLNEYLTLDLVPYGLVKRQKVAGVWKFECENGVHECYGNKVHACVLEQKRYKGQVKVINMMNCFINSDYNDENVRQCSETNGYDYMRLKRCIITTSSNLLASFGDRTESMDPKVPFVPMLLFNGEFKKTLDEKGSKNLVKTLCSLYKRPKPVECPVPRRRIKVEASGESEEQEN